MIITRFLPITYLISVCLFFIGCQNKSDWLINEKPIIEAPQNHAMPADFLRANISRTDYTALVFIKKAKIEGNVWWNFNTQGYVDHIYQAEVIETFKGPRHDQITYSVMAEANSELRLPNYPIVVSLCYLEGEKFYVPDNGYVSAAPESLIQYARELSRQKSSATRKTSVCK